MTGSNVVSRMFSMWALTRDLAGFRLLLHVLSSYILGKYMFLILVMRRKDDIHILRNKRKNENEWKVIFKLSSFVVLKMMWVPATLSTEELKLEGCSKQLLTISFYKLPLKPVVKSYLPSPEWSQC